MMLIMTPEGFQEQLEQPYLLFFDGGCRPVNPGGIAFCSYICYKPDGNKLFDGAELVCRETKLATNNRAEWYGLLFGCRRLKEFSEIEFLEIRGDSMSVIKSLCKIGRNKDWFADIRNESQNILKTYKWTAHHYPRKYNKIADKLADDLYEKIIIKEPFQESKLWKNHWYNQPATKKQIAFLEKRGIKFPDNLTKIEAFRISSSFAGVVEKKQKRTKKKKETPNDVQ